MTTLPNLAAAASDQLKALQATLSASQRSWLEKAPLDAAIDAIDLVDGGIAYGGPRDDLDFVVGEVEALGGADWSAVYLRMVMLTLLARGRVHEPPVALPPSIAELQTAELRRILDDVDGVTQGRYELANDLFRHDIEFCCHRLIQLGNVVGVTDLSLPPDVSRRYPDAPSGPWLEVHLRVQDYVREGAIGRPSRRRRAEFLEANPHYAGTFSVSWMNDPALNDISPHQAERRQSAEAVGARLFEMSTDQDTIAFAIAASKTRRRMYEEGEYIPKDYAMVWPREAMIRWARAASD